MSEQGKQVLVLVKRVTCRHNRNILKENAKVCPREGFSGYKQIIFLLQASAIY
ncbi:hypothetical protein BACCELL_00613 [Bacteroides cellulosilyticus DSM 14838]|uniref:Uncharacterized protein n=1 Tax=Bacteroides cellulosilyticus DSM 14838 TaxID=537012 RepID=E2N8L9_9BACE|nr:hypothetical protein BACCELL_00613 [Bacteroides cellulosilyticus DSM 14838]